MDTTKDIKPNKLYDAAIAKFEAVKAEALAHLEVLFQNPVGIGEHTDLLKEITMWTEKLASSDEAIEILERTFDEEGKVS